VQARDFIWAAAHWRTFGFPKKGRFLMTSKISIEKIYQLEVKRLLEDTKFSRLKPILCSHCGKKTGFERRLYQIKGVPKSKHFDEEIQEIIRNHFKQNYSIEHIFFKTVDRRFIVDTATCGNCQSTAIIYDIELTSDLMSEISKFTGKSESQLLKDLIVFTDKLTKD
jgi:hypothetical protein